MGAKKNIKHDLYECSIIADTAHIEMLYEVHTNPDRDRLIRFGCAQCTKCGVGIPISAWETKLDWEKCIHPMSPKP